MATAEDRSVREKRERIERMIEDDRQALREAREHRERQRAAASEVQRQLVRVRQTLRRAAG